MDISKDITTEEWNESFFNLNEEFLFEEGLPFDMEARCRILVQRCKELNRKLQEKGVDVYGNKITT